MSCRVTDIVEYVTNAKWKRAGHIARWTIQAQSGRERA